MNAPLPDERSPFADGYPQTVALIALTTAAAVGSRRWLALPDVAMLYLLVIVAVAVRYGRCPSVLASALSVATYDFFFLAPYYTFAVDDLRNLLTFATMFVIGQHNRVLHTRVAHLGAYGHGPLAQDPLRLPLPQRPAGQHVFQHPAQPRRRARHADRAVTWAARWPRD